MSDPFQTVYINTMLWMFFFIRLNCYFNLYFWGLMKYIYNQHFSCIIHHLGWILSAELITVHYGIAFYVKDTCDATLVQTQVSNYISCQKHVWKYIICCLHRQLSRFWNCFLFGILWCLRAEKFFVCLFFCQMNPLVESLQLQIYK